MDFLKAYIQFDKLMNWCHKEFQDSAANFVRDMKSLRALWNYLYLALYIFLCVMAALSGNPSVLKTAIVTTGGIVGTIFTVYVWSKHRDKEMEHSSGKKTHK